LVRIFPYGNTVRNASGITSQFPTGAHLTYFGGPVISNIQVVAVFWGPNVSPAVTANGAIDQFYTDITSSRYFDLLTEYTTAGVVGANGTSTSSQTIGHGTFGGKFTITPSVCPESTLPTTACTVTDAQIQTELTNQINAGHLPGPQTDGHGIINTYYAVYFPPSVTISLPNGNGGVINSCVSGGFCAYHSDTGSNLPYGVMPDYSTGGCSIGCGTGTTLQIATNVSSHEMAEAITDAQVGSASVFGPPLGWYDNPPNLGEIADLCDPAQATVSAGTHSYTVEPLFSNVQNDCVTAPPKMQMPDSGAGPGVPFNLTLTVQNSNTGTPLSGYLGTVHFTSSDNAAVLPADFTYTSGDAGAHTFQFTLNTPGNQTISVVDTRAGGFTGSATINVSTAIDLAETGSPGLIATSQGATGLTFTTTVRNNGGSASTGAVSVVATLTSGLNPTAIAGTGWTCVLATLTCTRSDALASGTNYPDVVVTFSVASNATGTATISSTVSGGGDTDVSNNSAAATVKIASVISIGTATPATNTVAAGASAQYLMAITLGAGSGTTTFSCSGLPTAAACSFSPTSLSSSGNVTMTVTTTARGAIVSFPSPGNRSPWLPGLLSLMVATALRLMFRTRPRARRLAPALGACAFLLVGILAGCGGGGGTPQTITNPVVGTPAGTYTITFTATSPSSSASSKVSLIVN
jgi:hypothetical protein